MLKFDKSFRCFRALLTDCLMHWKFLSDVMPFQYFVPRSHFSRHVIFAMMSSFKISLTANFHSSICEPFESSARLRLVWQALLKHDDRSTRACTKNMILEDLSCWVIFLCFWPLGRKYIAFWTSLCQCAT